MADAATDADEGLGAPQGRRLEENPKYLWALLRSAVDYMALNTDTVRDMMVRAKPYPDPFVLSHVEGHAGADLGCWVGMRSEPAPLVIFVPGTFATKDVASTRSKVLRLYRGSDVSVCALDLRGFGHSAGTRSTGGYLESRDLAHVATHFAEDDRVTRVVLFGESLGGSASLIAATRASGAVDGVLAVNPFADLEWITRFLSEPPPRGHPFYVTYYAFRTMLRHVTGRDNERFDTYIAKVARSLGISAAELAFRSSPRHHLREVGVPALVLNAVDDPIIPPFHAHVLRAAARGNEKVRVHLTELGGHTYFDLVDEAWYWETIDRFLMEVAQ